MLINGIDFEKTWKLKSIANEAEKYCFIALSIHL